MRVKLVLAMPLRRMGRGQVDGVVAQGPTHPRTVHVLIAEHTGVRVPVFRLFYHGFLRSPCCACLLPQLQLGEVVMIDLLQVVDHLDQLFLSLSPPILALDRFLLLLSPHSLSSLLSLFPLAQFVL